MGLQEVRPEVDRHLAGPWRSAVCAILNWVQRDPQAWSGRRTISGLRLLGALAVLMMHMSIAGCLIGHRIKDIRQNPYPLIHEDDSTVKYGDQDDDVVIEVRRAKISRPLDNLAVHYPTLFPGGEMIRPGDTEEYVKVGEKNAYRVTFKKKYIRKRKRVLEGSETPPADTQRDWTSITIPDPDTGKQIPVLYGPVIEREKILYLVPGRSEVYAIMLRADGDAIEPARTRFETFVRNEIDYR
jgi:hypothetical protein